MILKCVAFALIHGFHSCFAMIHCGLKENHYGLCYTKNLKPEARLSRDKALSAPGHVDTERMECQPRRIFTKGRREVLGAF